MSILTGVWFINAWIFFNYMIVQFYSISMRFAKLIEKDAKISICRARTLMLLISFIMFCSNIDEYLVEYGLELNCEFFQNKRLGEVLLWAWLLTIYQHNVEMVVLGLFTLYMINFMVKRLNPNRVNLEK